MLDRVCTARWASSESWCRQVDATSCIQPFTAPWPNRLGSEPLLQLILRGRNVRRSRRRILRSMLDGESERVCAYPVGGGHAGLASALYLLRDGQVPEGNTCLLEESMPGGSLVSLDDELDHLQTRLAAG